MEDQVQHEPQNFWQKTVHFIKEKAITMRNKWRAFRKNKPRLAIALLVLFIGFFVAIFSLFLFIALVYFGAFGRLPDNDDLRSVQNYTASEVYSEDEVLLGKYYIENRVNADFKELSPFLLDALVATEDARFFEHSGVDMRALMRVFFKSILMQKDEAGGGSTLSQQLVKNLYGRERYRFFSMPITKVKEMFIARRLEDVYTKKELLNLYLNTVSFSGDIYGVKVASRRFFGTNPNELKVEEAAVLVGMLKATTAYNPLRNPERSMKRRNVVLAQMVKENYLSQVEYDSLKALPLETNSYKEGNNEGVATYFREHLRNELEDILKDTENPKNGKPYNIYTDGLRIYTTINSKFQDYAEEAVAEHLALLQKDFDGHWKGNKSWGTDALLEKEKKKSARYRRSKANGLSKAQIDKAFNTPTKMTVFSWDKGGETAREMSPLDSIKYYLATLHAGFLVMQPQTGAIQAWVGGTNQKYFQYDHVKSQRQVGSTFKPIVYAAALKSGKTPCDYFDNNLVTYTEWDDWQPQNSGGKYGGLYSMAGGLQNSINAVTVDVLWKTGVDSVYQLAKELGVTSDIPKLASIALGAGEISLYEMVQVYGTFANKGKQPTPHYLTRIEDANGNLVVEIEQPNAAEFPEILTEEEAMQLTTMLQSVVDSGTAQRLRYQYHLTNEIAGKTGTTQDQSDGWFMGYTPAFVAGAWVGAEYPVVHWNSLRLGQGANTALPIWGRFANKVYKDKDYAKLQNWSFPSMPDSIQAKIDCPRFFANQEELDAYFYVAEAENEGVINGGLRDLFEQSMRPTRENRPSKSTRRGQVNKRPTRAESQRSREIRERNERLKKQRERKKNRKKKFNKLFGKEQ